MTLHPARSLVVCALVASFAGCAETNGRVVMEEPSDWSAPIVITSPGPRFLTYSRPQILPLRDAFIVVFLAYTLEGVPLITMSSFDRDGNLLVDQRDLVVGPMSYETLPRVVAATAEDDGTFSLYWTTAGGLLGSLRASSRGDILREPEYLTVGPLAATSRFDVVRTEAQTIIVLQLQTYEHVLIPVERDGSLGEPRTRESWPVLAGELRALAFPDRVQLAWLSVEAVTEDYVFWKATADRLADTVETPREIFRAEYASLTGMFIANDAPWVEVTSFDSSALLDLSSDAPPFTFMTGFNRGSHWYANETEVFAITEEMSEAYSPPPGRVVFRRIDLRTRAVLEETPLMIGSECGTGLETAGIGDTLAVLYRGCGMSLYTRVRRPR